MWKERQKGMSIGRMPHILPSAGELNNLRLLLTIVKGPKSYDEIKTFQGVVYKTFKEACFARGLLDDDREYISAVKEAATWASGRGLRKLFVSMLLCGSLKQPDVVWKEISSLLADDLYYVNRHETARTGNDKLIPNF